MGCASLHYTRGLVSNPCDPGGGLSSSPSHADLDASDFALAASVLRFGMRPALVLGRHGKRTWTSELIISLSGGDVHDNGGEMRCFVTLLTRLVVGILRVGHVLEENGGGACPSANMGNTEGAKQRIEPQELKCNVQTETNPVQAIWRDDGRYYQMLTIFRHRYFAKPGHSGRYQCGPPPSSRAAASAGT